MSHVSHSHSKMTFAVHPTVNLIFLAAGLYLLSWLWRLPSWFSSLPSSYKCPLTQVLPMRCMWKFMTSGNPRERWRYKDIDWENLDYWTNADKYLLPDFLIHRNHFCLLKPVYWGFLLLVGEHSGNTWSFTFHPPHSFCTTETANPVPLPWQALGLSCTCENISFFLCLKALPPWPEFYLIFHIFL